MSRGGLSPFELAELRTYDWRLTHTARPETARQDIALVEIDEYSLRNLQPNAGRWPWPRVVHAMLIDYLARAPAKVIAYDVVFSEADTRRGFDFGESTLSGRRVGPGAGRFGEGGRQRHPGRRRARTTPRSSTRALPDAGYPLDVAGVYERAASCRRSTVLAAAAAGLGHNLFVLDPDGPLRHTMPFVRTQHRVVPSLGVSAALRVAGIRPQDVAPRRRRALRVGDRVMPLARRRVHGGRRRARATCGA